MIQILLSWLLTISPVQATEPTARYRLPVKLTSEQLIESDKKAQNCFRYAINRGKKAVKQALDPFLPSPLIAIIEGYLNQFSSMWRTVNVFGLVFEQRNLETQPSNTIALSVDVPSRYGLGSEPFPLHNKDIFNACMMLLNHRPSVSSWRNNIRLPIMQKKFDTFFQNTIEYSTSQEAVAVNLPQIDHFPLVVYWKNEKNPLSRITSAPIFKYSPPGSYNDNIDMGCLEILKEHKKLPHDWQTSNLVIFCTVCNGQIKYPWGNCSWLLQDAPELSNDSEFCNGSHQRCCTFRALRVFPDIKSYAAIIREREPFVNYVQD